MEVRIKRQKGTITDTIRTRNDHERKSDRAGYGRRQLYTPRTRHDHANRGNLAAFERRDKNVSGMYHGTKYEQ